MCKLCLPFPKFKSLDFCGFLPFSNDDEDLVHLKAEIEVGFKLLEQDICEKRDAILNVKRELDELKLSNFELYKKLGVNKNSSTRQIISIFFDLETNLQNISDSIYTLESRYKDYELLRLSAESQRNELLSRIRTREDQQNESSETNERSDKEDIEELQHCLNELRQITQKYSVLQEEYYALKEFCLDEERNLNKLYRKIREICEDKSHLIVTRRKMQLHSKSCGNIVCHSCSDNSVSTVPSSSKEALKVCDKCDQVYNKRTL